MCNLYLVIFFCFFVRLWRMQLVLRSLDENNVKAIAYYCVLTKWTLFFLDVVIRVTKQHFFCMIFFLQKLHQSSSYANREKQKIIHYFVIAGTTVDFVCWISRVTIWSKHHHHYWLANVSRPINNANWFSDQIQKFARLQSLLVFSVSKLIRWVEWHASNKYLYICTPCRLKIWKKA